MDSSEIIGVVGTLGNVLALSVLFILWREIYLKVKQMHEVGGREWWLLRGTPKILFCAECLVGFLTLFSEVNKVVSSLAGKNSGGVVIGSLILTGIIACMIIGFALSEAEQKPVEPSLDNLREKKISGEDSIYILDEDPTIDEMSKSERIYWKKTLTSDKKVLEAVIKDAQKNLKDINNDLKELERVDKK